MPTFEQQVARRITPIMEQHGFSGQSLWFALRKKDVARLARFFAIPIPTDDGNPTQRLTVQATCGTMTLAKAKKDGHADFVVDHDKRVRVGFDSGPLGRVFQPLFFDVPAADDAALDPAQLDQLAAYADFVARFLARKRIRRDEITRYIGDEPWRKEKIRNAKTAFVISQMMALPGAIVFALVFRKSPLLAGGLAFILMTITMFTLLYFLMRRIR